MIIGVLIGVLAMSFLVGLIFALEDLHGANDGTEIATFFLGFVITIPTFSIFWVIRKIRKAREKKLAATIAK